MSLMNFFGFVIKPRKLRGTGVLNPAPTQVIDERLSCVRQYDVNLWIYRKGGTVIAVDSGYAEFAGAGEELKKIGLDPETVSAVFLTHGDMDHGGGLFRAGGSLFPNAAVYLHREEEALLTGRAYRFARGPVRMRNPVREEGIYNLLDDGDRVRVGEVEIQAFHVPGHTPGHSVYLTDGILFSGDCMAVNGEGGYGFFDLFNMDTPGNLRSLTELKKRMEGIPLEIVCTGHSGYTRDTDRIFAHIGETARGTRRKPFDPKAPENPFSVGGFENR